MVYFLNHYKVLIRLGCILAVASFLYTDVLWALPGVEIPDTTSQPFSLHIPENIGTIREIWQPVLPVEPVLPVRAKRAKRAQRAKQAKPRVFLLQDSHCNYQAQQNIAQILRILNPSLIGLEGAKGPVNTSFLSSIPDEEIRQKISDYYMKKGYLTGTEYFSITENPAIPLYGLEDADLYFENLEYFKKVYSHKSQGLGHIRKKKKALEKLAKKIFSPELKELREKRLDYENNSILFSDYCLYLNKKIEATSPNLKILIELLALEDKIIIKEVERERAQLIMELEKQLPKEELKELVKKSLEFRLGKIPALQYYSYLEQYLNWLNEPNGLNGLNGLIQTLKLQAHINKDLLFHEVDQLETEIKEKLFQNKEQRQLDQQLKLIETMEKLVHLKMTRADWDWYNKIDPPHPSLSPMGRGVGVRGDFIKPAERFYELAVERDEAIVQNLREQMDKSGVQNTVMVIGGFHTKGLTEALKAKGISYAVISPNIQDPLLPTPYQSIMMNEKDPLEELLARVGNRIGPVITSPNDLTYISPEAAEKLGIVASGAKVLSATMKISAGKGLGLWNKLAAHKGTPREEKIRKEIVKIINDFWSEWWGKLDEETRRRLAGIWKKIGPVLPRSLKKDEDDYTLAFDIAGPEDLLVEFPPVLGEIVRVSVAPTKETESVKPLEDIFKPIKIWWQESISGGRVEIRGISDNAEAERMKKLFGSYFRKSRGQKFLRFDTIQETQKMAESIATHLSFPGKISKEKADMFKGQIIDLDGDPTEGRIVTEAERRVFFIDERKLDHYRQKAKNAEKFNRLIDRLNWLLNELPHFPLGTTRVIIRTDIDKPLFYNKDDNILEIHGLLLTEDIDPHTTLFAGRHDQRHLLMDWPKEGFKLEEELLNIYMDLMYLAAQKEEVAHKILGDLQGIEDYGGYHTILWNYLNPDGEGVLKNIIEYVLENYPGVAEGFKEKHKLKEVNGEIVTRILNKEWKTFGSPLRTVLGFYAPDLEDKDLWEILPQMAKACLNCIEKLSRLDKAIRDISMIITEAEEPLGLEDIAGEHKSAQGRARFILENMEANDEVARVFYGEEDIRYCTKSRADDLETLKQVVIGEEEETSCIVYIKTDCLEGQWAKDMVANRRFTIAFDQILLEVQKHHRELAITEWETNRRFLEEAFQIAREDQRKNKKRFTYTQEMYLEHSLQIALLMARNGADTMGVAAAILHKVEPQTIKDKYGEKHQIWRLINRCHGIDTLTGVPLKEALHALQNLHYLLIALSSNQKGEADWDVFLFLLLEKLSWLRDYTKNPDTYESLDPESKRDLARVVNEYYAPLAEYLGLEEIADEFRDLYFMITEPELYQKTKTFITRLLGIGYEDTEKVLRKIKNEVIEKMREIPELSISHVRARVKLPFSFRQKLEWTFDMDIEEIMKEIDADKNFEKMVRKKSEDIFGIQIIVGETSLSDRHTLNSVTQKVVELLSRCETIDKKTTEKKGYTGYDFIGYPKGHPNLPIEFQIYSSLKDYTDYKRGIMGHWLYKLIRYLELKRKREDRDKGAMVPERQERAEQGFDREFLDEIKHIFTQNPKENFQKLFKALRDNWVVAGVILEGENMDMLHVVRIPKQSATPARVASSRGINVMDDKFIGLESIDVADVEIRNFRVEQTGKREEPKIQGLLSSGLYRIHKEPKTPREDVLQRRFKPIMEETDDLRTYMLSAMVLDPGISQKAEDGKRLIAENLGRIGFTEKSITPALDQSIAGIAKELLGFRTPDGLYRAIYLANEEYKTGRRKLLYMLLQQLYKTLLNQSREANEDTLKETARIFDIKDDFRKGTPVLPLIYLLLSPEKGRRLLQKKGFDLTDPETQKKLLLLLDDYDINNVTQLYAKIGTYPYIMKEIQVKWEIVDFPWIEFNVKEGADTNRACAKACRILRERNMDIITDKVEGQTVTIQFVQQKYGKQMIRETIAIINKLPEIEEPVEEEHYHKPGNLKERDIVVILPNPRMEDKAIQVIGEASRFLYGRVKGQERKFYRRNGTMKGVRIKIKVDIPKGIPDETFVNIVKARFKNEGITEADISPGKTVRVITIVSTQHNPNTCKDAVLEHLQIEGAEILGTRTYGDQLIITYRVPLEIDNHALVDTITVMVKGQGISNAIVTVQSPKVSMPGRIKQEHIDWFRETYGDFGNIQSYIGQDNRFQAEISTEEFAKIRNLQKFKQMLENLDALLARYLTEFQKGTRVTIRTSGNKPIMYNKRDDILEIHALLLTDKVSTATRIFAGEHDQRHKLIKGASRLLEEILNIYIDFAQLAMSEEEGQILADLRNLEEPQGYWQLLENRKLLGQGRRERSHLWEMVLEYLWKDEDFKAEFQSLGITEFSVDNITRILREEIQSRRSALLKFMECMRSKHKSPLPVLFAALAVPLAKTPNYLKYENFAPIEKQCAEEIGYTVAKLKEKLNRLIYKNRLSPEDIKKVLKASRDEVSAFAAEASLENRAIDIDTEQDQNILNYLFFRLCWEKISGLRSRADFAISVQKQDLENYGLFFTFFADLITLKTRMDASREIYIDAIHKISDIQKSAVIVDVDILESANTGLKTTLAHTINQAKGKVLFVSSSDITTDEANKRVHKFLKEISARVEAQTMVRGDKGEEQFVNEVLSRATRIFKVPQDDIVLFTTNERFNACWRKALGNLLYCILYKDRLFLSSRAILAIKAINDGQLPDELKSRMAEAGLKLVPEYIYDERALEQLVERETDSSA